MQALLQLVKDLTSSQMSSRGFLQQRRRHIRCVGNKGVVKARHLSTSYRSLTHLRVVPNPCILVGSRLPTCVHPQNSIHAAHTVCQGLPLHEKAEEPHVSAEHCCPAPQK